MNSHRRSNWPENLFCDGWDGHANHVDTVDAWEDVSLSQVCLGSAAFRIECINHLISQWLVSWEYVVVRWAYDILVKDGNRTDEGKKTRMSLGTHWDRATRQTMPTPLVGFLGPVDPFWRMLETIGLACTTVQVGHSVRICASNGTTIRCFEQYLRSLSSRRGWCPFLAAVLPEQLNFLNFHL